MNIEAPQDPVNASVIDDILRAVGPLANDKAAPAFDEEDLRVAMTLESDEIIETSTARSTESASVALAGAIKGLHAPVGGVATAKGIVAVLSSCGYVAATEIRAATNALRAQAPDDAHVVCAASGVRSEALGVSVELWVRTVAHSQSTLV